MKLKVFVANNRAEAAPMPVAPPETMAILPLSLSMSSPLKPDRAAGAWSNNATRPHSCASQQRAG